eukprot:TRINITY_DN1861_c0_g1_i4.p1 TRINITY_DN1861_c0_g1~~TRINITY_DN1861_c0_g1_i4.p1  ORF type:complete len:128 (+),score=7.62 TRINITY_DN1861_c0_g1_i4:113-496(+)
MCYTDLKEDYKGSYEFHRDGKHEIIKPRWKGIKRSDRVIRDDVLCDVIKSGRASSEMMYNLYWKGKLSYALSIETYKEMIRNPKKEVYILSNRMERATERGTEKKFCVTNRYVIKKFTPESDEMQVL